jgi:hypothetical protein
LEQKKLDLVNERHCQIRRGHLTTEKTRTKVKWTALSILNVTQHFFFAVFSGQKFVAMREVREAAVAVFLFLFLHSFCLLFINGVQKSLLLFFCCGKYFRLWQPDNFGHQHGGIKKLSCVSPFEKWTCYHFFCFVKGRTENVETKLLVISTCIKCKSKQRHFEVFSVNVLNETKISN